MDASAVVLATLVVYNGVLLGIGAWAQRRTQAADDFFVGDRALGPVVAAISYSASSSSAWTLLGMSGAAYALGLPAVWLALGGVVGMVLAWHFLAPALMRLSHRHRLVTMTDLLALGIDGPWRRAIVVTSSLIVIVMFVFYVAAQFQGAGAAFERLFGLPMATNIVLGAAIILAYTLLGGFSAVSVTDVVQGTLMAFVALALPLGALAACGGFGGFLDGLRAVSTPEQLSLSGRNVGLAGAGVIVGTLAVGLGTFGQPHLMVRFMSLRDDTALRRARWITLMWFIAVFGGMCFAGLAGRVLLPPLANAESLFFALTDRLFPVVMGAVMMAAVLSAVMSTADSQLLVGASAVVHDLGLQRRLPHGRLLLSRLAMTAMVVAAIVVALTLPATIFERALLAWTALGAAFGPLIFFRAADAEVAPVAVFGSIVAGFSLALLFHFNPGSLVQLWLHPQLSPTLLERGLSFAVATTILWAGRTGRARQVIGDLSIRS